MYTFVEYPVGTAKLTEVRAGGELLATNALLVLQSSRMARRRCMLATVTLERVKRKENFKLLRTLVS